MYGPGAGRAAVPLAAASAVLLGLWAGAAPIAAAPSPVLSVAAPAFDSPGGMATTVVTLSSLPAGYQVALSVRVGSWPTSCDPFQWHHGPGAAVSQTCYVALPKVAGTWTMRVGATATKTGAPTRVYAGSGTIRTEGPATTPVSAAVRHLISTCYNATPAVRLTFDDGYTSAANLSSILATLKAYNVRGRFFLIGSWARANPSMVAKIKSGGHILENHTSSHLPLNKLSNARVTSEIRGGQPASTHPRLLRAPYGAGTYTSRLVNLAAAQGYRLCHWGSETRDWSGNSAASIVAKVLHGDNLTAPARTGDSILMHLMNTQSRYALPSMIRSLRAKGLALDKLR